MADLRPEHKRSFEFLLGMDKNFVSDFNDRSLREFLLDYDVDIDLDKYCVNGISMVSRLRTLLKIEPNQVAIEVMCVLLAHSQASLRRSMSGCLQIGEERRGEVERRIGEIEKLISELEKTLPDQKVKVKIYTDTGADISYLKDFFRNCDFCTFPYDSSHRRKKAPKPILARPSKAQWRDLNASWKELKFPWSDFSPSPIFYRIKEIVGSGNRRDILHLDSAHKEGAHLFLTNDKDDIWDKRDEIEQIVCFKIYHTSSEKGQIQNAVVEILAKIQ